MKPVAFILLAAAAAQAQTTTTLKDAYKDVFRIGAALNVDGDSWLNNFPTRGRTNYPLLFDRQGKPKPAFDAVLQVVAPK